MTNVIQFPSKIVAENEILPNHPEKLPYSFDIIQTEQSGFVLIDACVPFHVAHALLEMLQAAHPTAA
jgi:hypothetical protein